VETGYARMRSYPNGPGGRSINLKFSGHLVFQKNLNRTLSIRTAFGCIRMGDSFRCNLTDINGNVIGKRNFIVHMDYLNIPLMLRIYPTINKNFFIQSGPYFGYLLRQEQRLGNFESIETKFNYLSFSDRLDQG